MRRQPAHHRKEFLHDRGTAHHSTTFETAGQVAFTGEDAAATIRIRTYIDQHLLESGQVERLAEAIGRTHFDRLDGVFDSRIPRHQHRLAPWVHVANRANHVKAAKIRHPQVDQCGVGMSRPELRECLQPSGARNHFEPGPSRQPVDDVEHALFVVDDDENRRLCRHTYSLAIARIADRIARS